MTGLDVLPFLSEALIGLLSQPTGLLWIALGTMVGIISGATPGLTATMGVAVFIPVTFSLPADVALGTLIGIYCGGIAGGSIPAILLNIPGTPSAVMTTRDGNPMAKAGHGGRAVGWAIVASVCGGLLSWAVLVSVAPTLARLALRLGPPEYATLALFGLTIVVGIAPDKIGKGVLAALFGLALCFVGIDPIAGTGRWTFNRLELLQGINILPALIGFFAIPEILQSLAPARPAEVMQVTYRKIIPPFREITGQGVNLIRSSLIGIGVGMIPAVGGNIAAFIAYDQARQFDRKPERYGKGAPGGIVASEAANNGVTGGALIPLLTVGIPGDSVTAMLIGGLMIHGLQPGPRLFATSPDVVYGILAATLVANIMLYIFALLGFRYFLRVLSVPRHILAPALLVLTLIGGYALNNSWFDVVVMLILGGFGYIMSIAGFPVYPIVLGIVLGPILEAEMRRSLVIGGGDWAIFVERPVSLTFLALTVSALVVPWLIRRIKSRANGSG